VAVPHHAQQGQPPGWFYASPRDAQLTRWDGGRWTDDHALLCRHCGATVVMPAAQCVKCGGRIGEPWPRARRVARVVLLLLILAGVALVVLHRMT
jgi:hypothetical protein